MCKDEHDAWVPCQWQLSTAGGSGGEWLIVRFCPKCETVDRLVQKNPKMWSWEVLFDFDDE